MFNKDEILPELEKAKQKYGNINDQFSAKIYLITAKNEFERTGSKQSMADIMVLKSRYTQPI